MIYRFRQLSLKDQMRLEVDFGGEPIPEIEEDEIIKELCNHIQTLHPRWAPMVIPEKDFRVVAKAIKNLLT